MMKIYIDPDYKCFTSAAAGRREVEAEAFAGKCAAYIEGFRFVPAGESWTRSDGRVFPGEMITPWKDYNILAAYQEQYETLGGDLAATAAELAATAAELEDADAALAELGVVVNG